MFFSRDLFASDAPAEGVNRSDDDVAEPKSGKVVFAPFFALRRRAPVPARMPFDSPLDPPRLVPRWRLPRVASVALLRAPVIFSALAVEVVDPPFAGAGGTPLSRQIPPGCAFAPKLPRPATQLEEPLESALPPAPFAAPGSAFCTPNSPRPGDQFDRPLPPPAAFALERF